MDEIVDVKTVKKRRTNSVDITGKRFGRLVALYPTDNRDKKGFVIWHCKCDCGKETDASYNSLKYGNQVSCGCQKKEHDKKLEKLLTHISGTSIDALKSKKVPTDNTTGHKGVYLVRGKYLAKIVFQKKQYFLGMYDDIEDAIAARKNAEKLLFDDVYDFYQKWKEKADLDPVWAEENPVQIKVNRTGKSLEVEMYPTLD